MSANADDDRRPRPTASPDDLLRWAESLAGVARTGLGFTTNPYEMERFDEILHIAADIRAAADEAHGPGGEHRSPDQIRGEWLRAVGSGVPGYVTPKVAIGAVVGDDDGRLLLIQRSDSGTWLYPTGWADVGYSPAEVAVKEVLEETGIRREIVRPLAIIDGLRRGYSRIPLYSLVFHCRAVGGELAPHPQECLDAGWFAQHELPSPLASGDQWIDHAFAALAGDDTSVMYDLPRSPVWRPGAE